MKAEIKKALASSRTLLYRPDFAIALKSVPAAIYLQQILYWFYIDGKGKPFYKFRSKCSHMSYVDGDSFEEELGIPERTLRTAFSKFGSSNRGELSDNSIVTLRMDGNRYPWYSVNESALMAFLKEIKEKPTVKIVTGEHAESSLASDEKCSSPATKSVSRGMKPAVKNVTTSDDIVDSPTVKIVATSIQETITKTTQRNISPIDEKIDITKNSDASKMDKPSEDAKKKILYTSEFELVWTTYVTPVPSFKGKKDKAFKSFEKAISILSLDEILNALSLYMTDDYTFGRRPANLSTFLNGIVTNTKYRSDYIENRYDKMVRRQEHYSGNTKTALDRYKSDITLQGPLSRSDLIGRTAELDFNLSRVFKDKGYIIGFFKNNPREEWVKFIGEEYVALKIVSPSNKDETMMTLFTIEELRNNLYVHFHGYEWSDKLEEHYIKSNQKAKPLLEDKTSNKIALDDGDVIDAEIDAEDLID